MLKYNMAQKQSRILVAFSGGADSLSLLCALLSIQEDWELSIAAAHIDHGLRGEASKADADWAEAFCRERGVLFFRGYWPGYQEVKAGRSPEIAARNARRRFLTDTLEQWPGDAVALGHHLHDQAETVLIHMLNGAGLRGLSGMSPVQGRYIRPLLEVSRPMILEYIAELGLTPREDETNEEPAYLRNRLRLQVMPILEACNPGFAAAAGRMAGLVRLEDDFLDRLAREALVTLKQAPDAVSRHSAGLDLIELDSARPDPIKHDSSGPDPARPDPNEPDPARLEAWRVLAGIPADEPALPRISLQGLQSLDPVIARRALRLWISEETAHISIDMAGTERLYRLALTGRRGAVAEANGGIRVRKDKDWLALIRKAGEGGENSISSKSDKNGEIGEGSASSDSEYAGAVASLQGDTANQVNSAKDTSANGTAFHLTSAASAAAANSAAQDIARVSEIPVFPGDALRLAGGRVLVKARLLAEDDEGDGAGSGAGGSTGSGVGGSTGNGVGSSTGSGVGSDAGDGADADQSLPFDRFICVWPEAGLQPVLRFRRPGDWLQMPYGRKKLKDMFIEKGVPRCFRDTMPLLATGARILWIPGVVKASDTIQKKQFPEKQGNHSAAAEKHIEFICIID